MNIRKMTIDDYQKVYSLWMSCTGMGLNSLDDSKEGIQKFLERNPETCFVAENKTEILGAIMAGNDGRRGYIYHTSVNPEFQGKGIGSELATAAIKALERCGINKVALVVFGRNRAGNAFWEKQGFSARDDLVYRNKAIKTMERIDT